MPLTCDFEKKSILGYNPTMSQKNKVVTRFAPSPTGHLHIGGVRTALFSYLYARQNNGKFILRIEDTDKERSKKEFEASILESFEWLGLEYDELHRQSENTAKYKFYLEKLIEENKAYLSKEEAHEEGSRSSVIRFKNPNKDVVFFDHVLGEIKVNTEDLGDFVIAKDLDTPIFHFANVIDDYEMSVTHIIRGQEHASNTPRQILIWEALGFSLPEYAHIPLILAPDKTKMSKRHGALSTTEYRDLGYLPEAILNFMALIGWNPGGEKEIFSMEELIEAFSIDRIQKSPGVFNSVKLDWLNKEYIKKMSYELQEEYISKYIPEIFHKMPQYSNERLHSIVPIIIERISKGKDIENMAESNELGYLFSQPKLDKKILLEQAHKHLDNNEEQTTIDILEKVINFLEEIKEEKWLSEEIKNALWQYASDTGRGVVLWPLRYALSGLIKSPDPFILSQIFGKEETISRIQNAVKALHS